MSRRILPVLPSARKLAGPECPRRHVHWACPRGTSGCRGMSVAALSAMKTPAADEVRNRQSLRASRRLLHPHACRCRGAGTSGRRARARTRSLGPMMGCQVITELACSRPDRVDRLVLVGPTVDPRWRSFGKQLPRWLLESVREPLSLLPILASDYVVFGPLRFLRSARIGHFHSQPDQLSCLRRISHVDPGLPSTRCARVPFALFAGGCRASVRSAVGKCKPR